MLYTYFRDIGSGIKCQLGMQNHLRKYLSTHVNGKIKGYINTIVSMGPYNDRRSREMPIYSYHNR